MSEEHESDSDIAVETGKPQAQVPRKYAVILHNDDYTTMEFVIDVLTRFFGKTEEQALQVTLQVHHSGRGVAGIYSYEVAETKVQQVTDYAKSSGHPLLCTAEPT